MPEKQIQATAQAKLKDSPQPETHSSVADEFLRKELDQAWHHYRHLEIMRARYFNFFLAIVTASAAFLALQLKDIRGYEQAGSPTIYLLSLAAFFFVLFGVTTALLATIVRIGWVLGAYEDILHGIHVQVYGADSPAFALWNVQERVPVSVSRGVFQVQRVAEYLTAGACILLLAAEFRIGLVLARYLSLHSWPPYVPIGFALVMLLIALALAFRVLKAEAARRLLATNRSTP